ncbi:MAG: hypothetical protein J7578_24965, partial [Chitinophagaceae bacterium]|nr:hypothetical protein [Chitinophagaceae bacterium]
MPTRILPYFTFIIFFVFFFTFIVHGQPRCGFDHLHNQLLERSPAFRETVSQANEKIRSWIQQKQATDRLTTNGRVINGAETIYEIPVVIHVMHTGGIIGTQYNPADAQLTNMIDYLNQSFQATWAGYSSATTGGTRVPFRFVLAQRAPDCTPTTGIIRVNAGAVPDYSSFGIRSQTTTGAIEEDLKALSVWPSNQYYNIWIVNRIDGKDGYAGTVGPFVAGYAYFPGAPNRLDGTIMLASQAIAGQSTLPHEMGHAFNLYHTFRDASGSTCALNTDCSSQGDMVCDTDPVNEDAFFTCPMAASNNPCTGNPWNGQQFNFMHYTSCADQRFTPGQRDRMIAAVNTVRGGLLTSAALRPVPATQVRTAGCEPTSITFNGNGFDMGPVRIRFNTLDDSTNSYSWDFRFYEDNTCNMGTSVMEGQTYTIALSTRSNLQVAKAWIDFNNNGIFDAAEQVLYSTTPPGYTDNNYTHTASVTIPSGTVQNIPVRMRILADWINNNTILPCEGQMYGQTEDYSVTVLPAGTLPVRIYDERISWQNGSVLFAFKSGEEKDIMKYELQRSDISGKIFSGIKELYPAIPFALVHEYFVTDDQPTADAGWYRIVATGKDGKKYYSRILGKPAANESLSGSPVIWPNPTRGGIYITLPLPSGLSAYIAITDTQGRLVWSGNRATGSPITIQG